MPGCQLAVTWPQVPPPEPAPGPAHGAWRAAGSSAARRSRAAGEAGKWLPGTAERPRERGASCRADSAGSVRGLPGTGSMVAHDEVGGLLPIKRTIRVLDVNSQSFREQEVRLQSKAEGVPSRSPGPGRL